MNTIIMLVSVLNAAVALIALYMFSRMLNILKSMAERADKPADPPKVEVNVPPSEPVVNVKAEQPIFLSEFKAVVDQAVRSAVKEAVRTAVKEASVPQRPAVVRNSVLPVHTPAPVINGPHRRETVNNTPAPEVVAAITAAIAAMGIKGKVVSIRPRTSERWKNAGRIESISGANRF